jgi:maltooligosyltrehalose trehalohydrolase
VLYELHVGTFTQEGTYRAAEREFGRLRQLGITVLEVMPINEFAGDFGWGYDGVHLYAPYHVYGAPDDLRHMIDAAHQAGLHVILDVVYNHFGAVGNYLSEFSPFYFAKEGTEWGDAPNFDGDNSKEVREFVLQNAEYWIRDFHFDGLRFDATQSLKDSGVHGEVILAALVRRSREAAGDRQIVLLSECERQESMQLLAPSEGGCDVDGMWNDDLHHSAVVRLTGKREAYYTDHLGKAQEFVSAAKYGFLFQGQYYSWQDAPRGTPFLGIEPWRWVTFLENHDQVANTLLNQRPRALASARLYRAMVAYWLLSPSTPMLFMGQEYGSERPFSYFLDQQGAIGESVRRGRINFLSQFESIRNTPNLKSVIANPAERTTFEASKLVALDRELPESVQLQTLFRDLLRLRREDPAIALQRRGNLDGAVLSDDCFVLRYFYEDPIHGASDRLLLVNFGSPLELSHLPEPLLAPPRTKRWSMRWHSEQLKYGGSSAELPITTKGWRVTEEATMLLIAAPLQ